MEKEEKKESEVDKDDDFTEKEWKTLEAGADSAYNQSEFILKAAWVCVRKDQVRRFKRVLRSFKDKIDINQTFKAQSHEV